jgi:hypothetical protein
VVDAKPEGVVHQLTAIARKADFGNLDRYFAATNELRTAGLDYLMDAAIAAGARRFVAQSFTGWTNPRNGAGLKTEQDPLDDQPAIKTTNTLAESLRSNVPSRSVAMTRVVITESSHHSSILAPA